MYLVYGRVRSTEQIRVPNLNAIESLYFFLPQLTKKPLPIRSECSRRFSHTLCPHSRVRSPKARWPAERDLRPVRSGGNAPPRGSGVGFRGRGGCRGGGGGGRFGGRGGARGRGGGYDEGPPAEVVGTFVVFHSLICVSDGLCFSFSLRYTSLIPDLDRFGSADLTLDGVIYVEISSFLHGCEGNAVTKLANEIYLT